MLGLILLVSACKPNFDSTEVNKIYDEVMVVHDDVMPKMGDIHKTKKKLKKMLHEQLENADSSRSNIIMSIKKLEEADEAMMQWMSDFKSEYKGATQEETITYYKDQKDQISQIAQEMLSSIKEGQKLIK